MIKVNDKNAWEFKEHLKSKYHANDELIFQSRFKKEFFKYMYDYIIQINHEVQISDRQISVICPISNTYCEALGAFYIKLSRLIE